MLGYHDLINALKLVEFITFFAATYILLYRCSEKTSHNIGREDISWTISRRGSKKLIFSREICRVMNCTGPLKIFGMIIITSIINRVIIESGHCVSLVWDT
jgi:hypothetical protein